MRVIFTKTTKKRVETEVPDEYGSDDTPRGAIVDCLLRDFEHRGLTVRQRLYDDADGSVENAIHQLERAYDMADRILAALRVRGTLPA